MVDELINWGVSERASAQTKRVFGGRASCHLSIEGDDLEPLHAFAKRIGLKREWFQEHRLMPHYDLTPLRREAALKAGAVFVSGRDQAVARRAKREAANMPGFVNLPLSAKSISAARALLKSVPFNGPATEPAKEEP